MPAKDYCSDCGAEFKKKELTWADGGLYCPDCLDNLEDWSAKFSHEIDYTKPKRRKQ